MSDASDKWSTLDNRDVYAIQPGSMQDCREYLERYKDVHGMAVYESPGHIYQYIAEKYQGEIQWDPNDVLVYSLDIETEVGHRDFPEDHKIKIRKKGG